jgi:glycosyltransferase involved in cell wall biosynthesis
MCAIPAGWACTHLDDPLAKRVVLTEHTGPFALVMHPSTGEAFVRAALAEAAAVAAVSECLRQDMLAAGIERNIAVIHNPVSADFTPSAPPALSPGEAQRPTFRAAFVGRLTELKGIPEMADAASALARDERWNIEWLIAGTGPCEALLRRRFAAANIESRLEMHGLCDKREVADILGKSHFLVLPSHGENCPLAICEALSVGRPVATTDAAGCKALVSDADGTVARIGDAESLRDAIERLISDYARWDWRETAARAKERFSSKAVAARYADIFDAVAQTGGSHAE